MAQQADAYASDFSPLDLVDELMDREIEDNSLKGLAFSISYLSLNYEVFEVIRNRALRVMEVALHSGGPRIAVRAAVSLSSVLSEFHPHMRNLPTAEEQAWQDRERLTALDIIERRIHAGNMSLPLIWKLGRSLRHVGRRDAQTSVVKERAAQVRALLPAPRFLRYFDILLTNQYEDAYQDGNDGVVPQSRYDHEEQARAELLEAFPNAAERVEAVEGLAREAHDAGINLMSIGEFVNQQCQDAAFLRAITEYVLTRPSSVLASVSQVPLTRWRDVDRGEFLRYGLLYALNSNVLLAITAGEAVSRGPALYHPCPADLTILKALARRSEGRVLDPVLFGLKRLIQVPIYCSYALALYAGLTIKNDYLLAKEYCDVFGSYGLPSHYLNAETLDRALENLVEVDELDRDGFGGLLARTFHVSPKGFIRLFEQRILRRIELGSLDAYCKYQPIPSSFSWSSIANEMDATVVREAAASLVDLMVMYPRFESSLSRIFWQLFHFNTATLSVLDEFLHRADNQGLSILAELLREGPRGLVFTHPSFAMHVLAFCTERDAALAESCEEALTRNALDDPNFHVHFGPPSLDLDNSHIANASAVSERWANGSLEQAFYSRLAGRRRMPVPAHEVIAMFGEGWLGDDADAEE